MSLHLLQSRELPLVFDRWRKQVTESIGRYSLGDVVDFLKAVNPRANYFPDFLTPFTDTGDLASGIDAVRSTPRRQFAAQLAKLPNTRVLPREVHLLAAGERDAVAYLCRGLNSYYEVAIAPFRQHIGLRLIGAQNNHGRQVTSRGSEALLRSLRPLFDWQPPVLLARFPYDFDVHLDGRGLLLIPSFFCVRYPVTLFDHNLTPLGTALLAGTPAIKRPPTD